MVTVLDYGKKVPGSSPGRGHCFVLRQDTFKLKLSQWLRPPRCINGYQQTSTSKFNARGNPAYHQRGSRNTLIASCYRKRDKLRPDEPLGL